MEGSKEMRIYLLRQECRVYNSMLALWVSLLVAQNKGVSIAKIGVMKQSSWKKKILKKDFGLWETEKT